MQLSVFYDHVLEAAEQTNKSVPEILKSCKEKNISALEVNNWTLKSNPENEQLIKAAGFKYNCIYEFYNFESSTDETKLKDHLERAARLKCHKVLIVPGFLSEEEAGVFSDCTDKKAVFEKMEANSKIQNIVFMLNKAVEYAARKNITVTLEDFDDYKSPCAHTNQLLYFFRKIPGLRFTLDTGNFLYSKEDVLNSYEILKEYIVNVHTKDRDVNLNSVSTGSGIIPEKILINKIVTQTGNQNFSIEHFGCSDQEKSILKSADFLTQILFTCPTS